MGVFIFAGTINRPLRLLTVCDNAANGLLIMLRSPTKLVTNIPPGVGADSSRPYPNIIKYTYSRHQIRVSVSPHTYIHIINYVFLHNQIRIFTSSNTCFRFNAHAYPHYRIRVFTLLNTHFHITAHAFPFVILWVFSYMRAR